MDGFATVRAAARALREAVADGDDAMDALSLARAAAGRRGLRLVPRPAGHPELEGGMGLLDRQFGVVLHDEALDERLLAEVLAHEIGHHVLHDGPQAGYRIRAGTSGESSEQRIETYGVKERREGQANAFAREFVLPRTLALRLYEAGEPAIAIADRLKVRPATAYQQLADGVLLPDPVVGPVVREPRRPLNTSQQRAAAHRGAPFLLGAGPGTGKTKTLVERIVGLIAQGAAPSSILALTFSNRAARELVERVGDAVGDPAVNIWAGTFHAFGLDIVRQHHALFGVGPDPAVVDATRAIEMIEEELPALELEHHVNLFEPAIPLRDMLRAISRAKDELRSPDEYAVLAAGMAATAVDDEGRLAAAKAAEVAVVYRHYDARLRAIGALDYGDLVMLPTLAMRRDADFGALMRDRFQWIHVDEYQDVNRASAMLVGELAGSGDRLWVVGDARQSLYRFRGASAANIARFQQDHPGGRRDALDRNYRSSSEIVASVVSFGAGMAVSRFAGPAALDAERGAGGAKPAIIEAEDEDDEMDALAGGVRDLEAAGVALNRQAVLARSNGTLGRVARELEARHVPVLYLGPLFDRDEVRDLLSILSLADDHAGSALLRVATFPEYRIPLGDARAVIADALQHGSTIVDAVRRVEALALTPAGKAGLRLLAGHMADVSQGTTPWLLLSRYLFDRSDYVRTVLAGQSPSDAMRRVAVRQLLDLLRKLPAVGGATPVRRALARIRTMIMLADDRDLRQLPPELDGLDGVRLMTIHASKGLEFDAVHLPAMHAGGIPASNRPAPCPPPPGLAEHEDEDDAHEAEEECALFVAMSRAKDSLTLYRAKRRGSRNSSPSRFLSRVPLVASQPRRRILSSTTPRTTASITAPAAPMRLTAADIEAYDGCPRRFLYDRVLGVGGWTRKGAHLDAHGCVQSVLRHMRALEPGTSYDREGAHAVFDAAWAATGLEAHPFGRQYRALVTAMVDRLHAAAAAGAAAPADITTVIGGERIAVTFDRIVADDGGTIARNLKSGKGSTSDPDRLSSTVAIKAAGETFGPSARLEAHYLASGITIAITQTTRKHTTRLTNCEDAIVAIRAGRYPPAPNDFTCPRCPHLFACPAPFDPT